MDDQNEVAELVEQAAKGDVAAYAILVRTYQNRLFSAMFVMVNSREDAEDLTQEAFARAYNKLSTFENRSSFFTWLHRIAVNLAISHRRKHRRENSMRQPEAQVDQIVSNATIETAADALEAKEVQSVVRDAISRLDDEHQAVLVLRDLQELGYAEIAEVLDIPPGTVRSRLHRARLELREILTMLLKSQPVEEVFRNA